MRPRENASWLLVLLIILSIMSMIQTGIVDASATSVSIDYYGMHNIVDPTLVPGSSFTINITVDFVEELWAYQFELGKSGWWEIDPAKYQGWNASILQLTAVENGPFLGSQKGNVIWFPGEINNTQGTLTLTGAVLDPKRRFPTGGGTLVILTFEVVDYGTSPIQFGLDTALLNKTNGYTLGPDWKIYRPSIHPTGWRGWLVDGYFDNRPQVKVEPSKVLAVPVGRDFSINIDVVQVTGVNNWVFSMKWNHTILDIKNVTEGDFLKSMGTTTFDSGRIDKTSGEITDVSASLATATGVSGSGTLASITFIVLDEGTSELALFNITLRDSGGDTVSVGTMDGFFTNVKFHNIEITSVDPNPVNVKMGSNDTIYIDVIVTNVGSYNETGIDVSAYFNENAIGTEENISLSKQANMTLMFEWDTTGVSQGIYAISATASSVPEEEETTDNTKESSIDVTIWLHDIAVTSVSAPVSNVFEGRSVNVTVVVRNRGTEIEVFNVTAYYDGNEIGTMNVTNLGYAEDITLQFEWDTIGVDMGSYTLSARASYVEGEEEKYRGNNVYVKPDKLNIVPFEEEPYSTEFLILMSLPFVIIGVAAVFYIRRRKAAGS